MLSQVLRTITRQGLLAGNSGGRILCAVSGGPDSMGLLACLWELAPRLRLQLEVATVDHGLRPQAAVEMALVEERAADLALPWHPVWVDVPAARRRHLPRGGDGSVTGAAARGGVQEVARRLRLAALAELAVRRGCASVALGHNADDQAETILFRIVRGTGLRGLAGIPYLRPPFIRPLLDVTRGQILAYLARRSLPYATDPSNADLRYARARLRHQILPLLRQENPRVDQALRSLGTLAAAARIRPRSVASPFNQASSAGVVPPPPPGEPGAGSDLTGPIPMQVRAEIEAAAREGHGTRSFDVAGGRRVTVSYGRVSISPDKPETRSGVRGRFPDLPPMEAGVTRVDGPGTYTVSPGWSVVVRDEGQPLPSEAIQAADVGDSASAAHETAWFWFDGDRLAWPLMVRSRRPGDRMRPRGGIGSRKLSDLLIDAKVPRAARGGLPVVTTADGELMFVPGLRPSGIATPSPRTKRRIGLAVVTKPDHDALVDRSIIKGNTGRRPYQRQGIAGRNRENQGELGTGSGGGTQRLDGRDR